MQITMEQAKKVLNGSQVFSQLGLSMMMLRLKRMYNQEPTPETLKNVTNEINIFLKKYENIMTADYAVMSSL